MEKITVTAGGVTLTFDPTALHTVIEAHGQAWEWEPHFRPYIETERTRYYLQTAMKQSHTLWQSGTGKGVLSTYSEFLNENGRVSPLSLETLIWVEESTGYVFFELIPLSEDIAQLKAVHWPGPIRFEQESEDWYSVINHLQGVMIPNNWPVEVSAKENPLIFEGQLGSAAAYMPWFGQVRPQGGYLALSLTPWDAAYGVEHPAGGPGTALSHRWLSSMGEISYRRILSYRFFENCDYVTLCKSYREYAKETGLFVTLKEKAVSYPAVEQLVGAAVVHKVIKAYHEHREESWDSRDRVVPFSKREEQMQVLKEKGVDRAYLHLDGWGDAGYDNRHPDYPPACIEAGGWAGMQKLADTLQALGYLLGLHDQYRDYYYTAPSFNLNNAVQNVDGTHMDQTRWAGGRQSFLCSSLAPDYLRRNFAELSARNLRPDCLYLDVFTCNEGDECVNPRHRVTRKECFEYRNKCFQYLRGQGVMPSSEESVDWAMPYLVISHYAPYDFMLQKPDSERRGIPVPLFNLVYHECVILPWMMQRSDTGGDWLLYALLNGGAAYLDVSAPNLEREISRWRIVSEFQRRVAHCEMTEHGFLSDDFSQEYVVYSDGSKVVADHKNQTWCILKTD